MRHTMWFGVLWLVVTCVPVRAELGPARELESRLFAPCCYTQTLDVQESDLASALCRRISGGAACDLRLEHTGTGPRAR